MGIEIPRIQRQTQDTPLLADRINIQPQLPENSIGDAVGKVLDVGTKYYQQQMEASANDYAKDSYLQIRDKFNKGFNSGEGDKLGLRSVEGHEQFVQGRNDLTEALNKKKEELLSKDGLSDYAKRKAEEKIDEAMSTFSYYMDVQEGQVKVADRTKKTALTVQAKTEDLNTIFGNHFDPNNGSSMRALDGELKDIRNTLYDSMVDSGTATKTLDKNGQAKYSVSAMGQFEVTKMMNKIVSEFTENVAAQSDGPRKAKAILENFDSYILPAAKVKIEKYIKDRATNTNAYSIVNDLVNVKDASEEDLAGKVSELMENGQVELAEKVDKLYPIILNKRREGAKVLAKGYADSLFKMIRMNGYTDLAVAEQNPEFLKMYNKIDDFSVKKDIDRFFTPPKISSNEALEQMEAFLESGSKDNVAFMKISSNLNGKDRKTYGSLYTGFGGTDTEGKKAKMTRSYINEAVKDLTAIDNYKFPDEGDREIISKFKSDFIDIVAKEPNLPDPYTKQGREYLNNVIRAFNDEEKLPMPNFKGQIKPTSSQNADLADKFERKFDRRPSDIELEWAKKNNGKFKDFRNGTIK